MLGNDPDPTPLVNGVDRSWAVWLSHVAIQELEFKIPDTRLLQETLCLSACFIDVFAEARELHQLCFGKRHAIARTHHAPNVFEGRNLTQRIGSTPPIDGHAQGLTHTHVVKRLARGVEND